MGSVGTMRDTNAARDLGHVTVHRDQMQPAGIKKHGIHPISKIPARSSDRSVHQPLDQKRDGPANQDGDEPGIAIDATEARHSRAISHSSPFPSFTAVCIPPRSGHFLPSPRPGPPPSDSRRRLASGIRRRQRIQSVQATTAENFWEKSLRGPTSDRICVNTL